MRTLPCALLLLAACGAPPGKTGPAASPGDLRIDASLDTSRMHPREGDLATAIFRIKNGTPDAVILRDLELVGSPGVAATWQFSRPGHLEYVKGADEWIYDRRKTGKPRPVFNAGFLPPGETTEIRTRLRLLRLPKTFRLAYFRLARPEVARKVYFEVPEGRQTRYRTLVGGDLDERLKTGPSSDGMDVRQSDQVNDLLKRLKEEKPGTASPDRRIVVFPHAEEVVSTAKLREVRVEAELRPRPFSLSDATAATGGGRPDGFTFCEMLDAWVLQRGDLFFLVRASGTVPLPRLRQMERVFYHLDAAEGDRIEVEFLRETKSLFAGGWRLVTDQDKGRYYVFLPADDLIRFLKDVREAGLDLDVDLFTDGGGRLIVTR